MRFALLAGIFRGLKDFAFCVTRRDPDRRCNVTQTPTTTTKKVREKTAEEITAKKVKKLIRDHKKGTRIEITDAKCQGLQFRLTDDAAIWTVRARLFDKQRRWTIGNSDVSPEDARERAGEVRAWCRRGSNPDKLVTQYMTGISMAKQLHFSAERPAPSWDWQKAVDNFLDHIRTKRAPDTYDDYARTLGGRMRLDPTKRHAQVAELSRFKGKQVNTIAREDIAECVADVCKRAHAQGLHTLRILGSMWSFLGDDVRRRQTSVAPNLLLRIKAPEKPQPVFVRPAPSVLQLFDNDQEDKRRDVPAPIELGRAVAIARSGALGVRASLAVQLLAFSLQRRRAIIGSYAMDYRIMAEWNDPEADIVWIIPHTCANDRISEELTSPTLWSSPAPAQKRYEGSMILRRSSNIHTTFPFASCPGRRPRTSTPIQASSIMPCNSCPV